MDDIPEFLLLTPDERKASWAAIPPTPSGGTVGYERTETERLYYESIEREQAAKRAADRARFATLRAKAAADKLEKTKVLAAAKRAKWRD